MKIKEEQRNYGIGKSWEGAWRRRVLFGGRTFEIVGRV
jgi:hypothetical protein